MTLSSDTLRQDKLCGTYDYQGVYNTSWNLKIILIFLLLLKMAEIPEGCQPENILKPFAILSMKV